MAPLSRVAVVTGANKGIGYFIALQLAVSGLFTDVIIGCRDSSRGAIASEEIQQKISAGSSSSSTKIHSLPLIIGNVQSHTEFCERLEQEFGSASVLVNSAGFAYKGSDPTPFKEQTKKTFETNYYGLIDFTEKMIPLLKKGTDPRLVNVASMAGRLTQLSSELQTKYTDEQLTIEQLNSLMKSFEKDVHDGVHRQKGWSSSNYGMSKLGVIAATKVFAREEPSISVNSCCPGYCNTDMTSNMGRRSPDDGAKNAVIPATMKNPPTGEHFADFDVSTW